jgi:excisionase family DNA binding protein
MDTVQSTSFECLLTMKEVAERLRISPATLWRLVAKGEVPSPVHLGARSTRWRAADIDRFIENL